MVLPAHKLSAAPAPSAASGPAAAPASAPELELVAPAPDKFALTKLEMPTKPGSPFDRNFWKRISTLANRPLAYSPTVDYLDDGAAAMQARLDNIAAAKSTIVMSTYVVECDSAGYTMLDALTAAAKRGVKVAVCFDMVPESFVNGEASDKNKKTLADKLAALGAAGGVICFYGHDEQMSDSLLSGNHLKLLLCDGAKAIAGGRNVGKDYFDGDWGDFDLGTSGTLAPQIGERVANTLKHTEYSESYVGDRKHPSLATQARFAAFMNDFQRDIITAKRNAEVTAQRALSQGHSPGTPLVLTTFNPSSDLRPAKPGESPNAITQALIETINRARTEIMVSCNYINGGDGIMEALMNAARRGVSVNIVTTSRTTSERSMMPYDNAHRWYGQLTAAGVRIWETYHNEHEKVVVVDNELGCTGSYNIELAAEEKLVEQMTWSADPTFVSRIHKKMTDVIEKSCKLYTPAAEPKLEWWQILFAPFYFPAHWIYVAFAYLLRKMI